LAFPLGVGGKSSELGCVNQTPSDWDSSKGIAKAILHNRTARRKYLAGFLLVTLGWMSCGLWFLDGWLADSIWRFLVWWGACGLLSIVLIMFAIYDALMTIREEKSRKR